MKWNGKNGVNRVTEWMVDSRKERKKERKKERMNEWMNEWIVNE